jgi:hypothetical protein
LILDRLFLKEMFFSKIIHDEKKLIHWRISLNVVIFLLHYVTSAKNAKDTWDRSYAKDNMLFTKYNVAILQVYPNDFIILLEMNTNDIYYYYCYILIFIVLQGSLKLT